MQKINKKSQLQKYYFILIVVVIIFFSIFAIKSFSGGEAIKDKMYDLGVSGMKIWEIKINSVEYGELKLEIGDKLEFGGMEIEFDKINELSKKDKNSIKQNINLIDLNFITSKITYSQKIIIDYEEIRWNGTRYKLSMTPIELRPYYDEKGSFIVPNIFMDDEYNKRINYIDIAEQGGYALAYNDGINNIIELRIDNFLLKDLNNYYIDPIYTNSTDGFEISTSGNINPGGIEYTNNSFYIVDDIDFFVYHYNLSGSNMSGGFDMSGGGEAGKGVGIEYTNNSFYIVDDIDFFVYHYNLSGSNMSGGFGIGFGSPTGITSNETTFLVLGDFANFVYFIDLSGSVDGGYYTESSGATSIYENEIDSGDNSLWVVDNADDFVYHFDSMGNNLTDGFSINTYSNNPVGITKDSNNYSFWVVDNVDDFVYHFVLPPPSFESIGNFSLDEDFVIFSLDLSTNISDINTPDEDLNFTWTVNKTGIFNIAINNYTNNITFTSIANQTWNVDVNLTVLNPEGLQDSSYFTLNVIAINDNPWVDPILPDITKNEDFGTNASIMNLTNFIHDVEDATSQIIYTIASESNTSSIDCSIIKTDTVSCISIANATSSSNINISFTDTGGGLTSDVFTFSLTAVNDLPYWNPLLSNSTYSVNEDTVGNDVVLYTTWKASFRDVENDQTPSSPSITTNETTKMICSLDGSNNIDCTTYINATGAISASLTAQDADGAIINMSFNININAVNDNPWLTANVANINISEDSGNQTIISYADLNKNFSDVEENNALSFVGLTLNNNTALTKCGINNSATGDLICKPLTNNTGSVRLELVMNDSLNLNTSFNFILNVAPVNDNPWLNLSFANIQVNEDSGNSTIITSAQFKSNFSDVEDDGNPTSITLISENNTGLIDCGLDGSNVLYCNAQTNQSGSSRIELQMNDSGNLNTSFNFILNVAEVNDPPMIYDIGYNTTTLLRAGSFNITCRTWDLETSNSSLTVKLQYQNVTNAGWNNVTLLAYDSTNAYWEGVVITSTADDNLGTLDFNCSVSDGTDTRELIENDQVTISNNAPTMTASTNATTNEDDITIHLDLYPQIADIEDADTSLTIAFVSQTNSGVIDCSNTTGQYLTCKMPSANLSGQNIVTMKVTDTDGGTAQADYNITVDPVNDAPFPPLLYSPANSSILGDTTPTLEWYNSTDIDNANLKYGVEVSKDVDFATLNYTYYDITETTEPTSQTLPEVETGVTYYWRAFSTDGIVNSSDSETRNFQVDANIPSITNERKSPIIVYDNLTVTLNATITDAQLESVWLQSNFSGALMNYTNITQDLQINGSEFYYIIDSTNFTNQQNIKWQWFANDTVGNEAEGTSFIFQIQNRAPTTPNITLPVNNTNSTDTTITIKWQNSTDYDKGMVLKYYLEVSNISDFTLIPYVNNSIAEITSPTEDTTSSLADNIYYIRARATDSLSNSSYSPIITHTIDTTPPSFITTEPQNKTYNYNSSISINFTADDNLLEISTIYYSLDDNPNITLTINTTINVSEGQHTIQFFANDTLNNANTTEGITFVADATSPNVTITSPTGTVTSQDVSAVFNLSDNYKLDYCYYYVNIGASTHISNTKIENPSSSTTLSYTTTGGCSSTGYTFYINCNDTANSATTTSSAYTCTTPAPGPSGGGGGITPTLSTIGEPCDENKDCLSEFCDLNEKSNFYLTCRKDSLGNGVCESEFGETKENEEACAGLLGITTGTLAKWAFPILIIALLVVVLQPKGKQKSFKSHLRSFYNKLRRKVK